MAWTVVGTTATSGRSPAKALIAPREFQTVTTWERIALEVADIRLSLVRPGDSLPVPRYRRPSLLPGICDSGLSSSAPYSRDLRRDNLIAQFFPSQSLIRLPCAPPEPIIQLPPRSWRS